MLKEFGIGLSLILSICLVCQATEPIFPYKYNVEVLPNGLKVITIPMESNGIVAYYSITRTGSRDEWEPAHSGFAHLFEHMMFRGTEKYPGPLYDKIMTELGADANAYTTDDYTCYHLNFAATDLEKIIEMESDRFIDLKYNEQDFKTETGAVYGEYLKGKISPWFVLYEKLYDTAFDKHTYKHTTIGFEADVKAMPGMYKYSKSFFKRYYRPENVVLLIVGQIETARTLELIHKYYGKWQSGYVAPQIVSEPLQTAERIAEVSYPGKTLPILMVAYKSDAYDPDNRLYIAGLLLEQLAFGENSDLYKRLVLKEQKVEFITANFSVNRDAKLNEIYTMVKSEDDLDYVREQIYMTMEQFKTEVVDDTRLEELKMHLRYSFLMYLDTPDNVAGNLANYIAITGGIETVNQLFANIMTVTAVDIQEAAQYYGMLAKRTVIILKGVES
ncbi:MAG: pitrilysin family protein [Candidatus Marinimicrobia bacterium]|nr:pitrilysin family protein [Candidatus Neomarinimicrobiota bacterium]